MPRLPAKQREAEKIATKLSNGSYAAAANDSPAQHSWEEHAKNLLSHMNGDRRKRKQTLDKFIAALVKKREEFRKEKKTGAGSATEAIEFYQYALQKNTTWKAKVGKKSSKDIRSSPKKNKVDGSVASDEEIEIQEEYNKNDSSEVPSVRSPFKGKGQTVVDSESPVHSGRCREGRLKAKAEKQVKEEEVDDDDDLETTGHEDDDEDDHDDDGETLEGKVLPQTPQAPTFTREQIPQDVIKKLAPKATNSNSRHGQYNCKFCMDDETTETCCFCACRICFTKHGKASTILCDLCDGEYHINCLSPPLSSIPSFDWYCPTCTEAITKALNEPSSRVTLSKKGGKSKGNKSPSKIPAKKGATKAKAKLALKQKKSAYSAIQPRTASGRFAPKPKPGEVVEAPVVKRGPGRPPKSASKGSPEKKPGRKKLEKTEAFQSPGNVLMNKTLQQRSRSGRVVKRKAAYDEREEGAQLLKVPKVSTEDYDIDEKISTAIKSVPSAAAALAANTVISLTKDEIPETTLLDSGAQNLETSDLFDYSKSTDSPPKVKQTKSSLSLPDEDTTLDKPSSSSKYPRRKPGARECMQISRRFGSGIIPQNYMDILMDYCSRGKVEHLIRMRERLDEHSRFLELQLAGLECLVLEKGNAIRAPTKVPGKETVKSATKKIVAPVAHSKAPVEKKDSSYSNQMQNVSSDGKKDQMTIEPVKLQPMDSKPEPTQAYVPTMPPVQLSVSPKVQTMREAISPTT